MSAQRDLFGATAVSRVTRSASISDCGLYRYRLDRSWSSGSRVCWVMLNPSTADGATDDATLRKCIAFSKRWGHGGLVVVNLYAYRAREPKALRGPRVEPVGGPVADGQIRSALAESTAVVCGWGASTPPDAGVRIAEVLRMIEAAGREPMALGVTQSGAPKHPLYLPGNLDPRPLAEFSGS